MSFYYKRYVPVRKRREKALKKMAQLEKKGVKVQPVVVEGRKISKTFWGDAWCNHIEKFSDNDNRLPRGRTYVRNGSVCHLDIKPGEVHGIVSGSGLYNIEIKIDKLGVSRWKNLKKTCAGKVGSILELLQGRLSSSVMEIVTEPKDGLMPGRNQMKFKCDCPDSAGMCKHIASVLYGVGARLDLQPEMLFELRGVDPSELVGTLDIPVDASNELDGDLAALFGVELEAASKPKKGRAKRVPTNKTESKPANTKRSTKSTSSKTKQTNVTVKPFKPTKTAIKQLRKRLRLNKSQFAKLVTVSPATVTLWEEKPGRLKLRATSEKALIKAARLTKEQAWRRVGIK